MKDIMLTIGDVSENGQVTIIDEDRLCYLVLSESKGARGMRTISKALLKEFIEYAKKYPDASADDARNELKGQSDVDKFEYGYSSTILTMAKMAINNNLRIHQTQKNTVQPQRNDFYKPYLTALRTKPFVLLAGISGTGKSRIVRELAFRSCPEYLRDQAGTTPGNYCMIEVKPNWHDSTELLGYYSNISTRYHYTKFVKFLVKAMMFPEVPFFVCLDEMNLAPVEQYFAEVLSVMETRRKTGNEIKTGVLVEPKYFQIVSDKIGNGYIASKFFSNLPRVDYQNYAFNNSLKEQGLSIPDNVFIIGTVNMDDTTHQFSRKVIDRAMTIEMNGGNLMDMFGNSKALEYLPEGKEWPLSMFQPTYVSADDVLEAHPEVAVQIQKDLTEKLDGINEALKGTPFQVSYRVLNEMVIYLGVLLDDGIEYDEAVLQAVDQIMLMKILPRIEGDRDLLTICQDKSRLAMLELFAYTQTTKDKLKEMQERLDSQDFTRFWP